MLLSGQKIYNEHFFSVGAKICSKDERIQKEAICPDVFTNFIATIKREVDSIADNFKIILPENLTPLIASSPLSAPETICVTFNKPKRLNLNLIEELKAKKYEIAIELSEEDIDFVIPDFVSYVFVEECTISKFGKIPKNLNVSQLIVKDVRNYTLLEKLQALNIGLFMGTFLEKPSRCDKDEISPNKTSVINLLATLNDPDVELTSIAEIFTTDTVLSYKLLQIINSPLYRGLDSINSVQDALVRFGYNNLKKWVLMLSLCELTDKPVALIQTALQRAIMCQLIAEDEGFDDSDSFYTAALLSTLDAFLDNPLPDLLDDAAMSDELKNAILFYEGDIGETLKNVIDFQRGKVNESEESMTAYYIRSSQETTQTLQSIGIAPQKG